MNNAKSGGTTNVVLITTCDPATRTIQGRLKDQTIIPITVVTVPNAFRWPQVGEMWRVQGIKNNWYLAGRFEGSVEKIQIEQIAPGDGKFDANKGRMNSGQWIIDTIEDPTGTIVPTEHIVQFTGDVTVTDDPTNDRTVVSVSGGTIAPGTPGQIFTTNSEYALEFIDPPVYDVMDWGAVGDVQFFYTASVDGSTAVVTLNSDEYFSIQGNPVGKTVFVYNGTGSGVNLQGIVLSKDDTTYTLTLDTPSTYASYDVPMAIGTDDTYAIASAIEWIKDYTAGWKTMPTLSFPARTFLTGSISFRQGITLQGVEPGVAYTGNVGAVDQTNTGTMLLINTISDNWIDGAEIVTFDPWQQLNLINIGLAAAQQCTNGIAVNTPGGKIKGLYFQSQNDGPTLGFPFSGVSTCYGAGLLPLVVENSSVVTGMFVSVPIVVMRDVYVQGGFQTLRVGPASFGTITPYFENCIFDNATFGNIENDGIIDGTFIGCRFNDSLTIYNSYENTFLGGYIENLSVIGVDSCNFTDVTITNGILSQMFSSSFKGCTTPWINFPGGGIWLDFSLSTHIIINACVIGGVEWNTGVQIESDSSDYFIINNNDFSYCGTAINDLSSGTHKIFTPNL